MFDPVIPFAMKNIVLGRIVRLHLTSAGSHEDVTRGPFLLLKTSGEIKMQMALGPWMA